MQKLAAVVITQMDPQGLKYRRGRCGDREENGIRSLI